MNSDWASFLRCANKGTLKRWYLEAVEEYVAYCDSEKKDRFLGQTVGVCVKEYLVHRHESPRVAKRSNKKLNEACERGKFQAAYAGIVQ